MVAFNGQHCTAPQGNQPSFAVGFASNVWGCGSSVAPNALPDLKSAMVLQVIVLSPWLSLLKRLEIKACWWMDITGPEVPAFL